MVDCHDPLPLLFKYNPGPFAEGQHRSEWAGTSPINCQSRRCSQAGLMEAIPQLSSSFSDDTSLCQYDKNQPPGLGLDLTRQEEYSKFLNSIEIPWILQMKCYLVAPEIGGKRNTGRIAFLSLQKWNRGSMFEMVSSRPDRASQSWNQVFAVLEEGFPCLPL